MMFLICLRHSGVFLQEQGSKQLSEWLSGQFLDLSSSSRGSFLPRAWTPRFILTDLTDVSSRNVVSAQSDASN